MAKKEKMSTRERMMRRKEELAKKSQGGGLIFLKEGTARIRIKSPGPDEELGLEMVQFYLGKEMGTIISPATFDEPCPFMEKYLKLKESKKEADTNIAKELVPKRKWLIGGIGFKDIKGKEVDTDRIDKAFVIPRSVYQDIIDLYLDEDEAGDMTDPINGYDIKVTRTGSGKNDTSYSVLACKPTKLPKEYREDVDLQGIIKAQLKSYDELEEILEKYLSAKSDEDEEDERPRSKSHKYDDDDEEDDRPKKKKVGKKLGKKKNRSEDEDDLPF